MVGFSLMIRTSFDTPHGCACWALIEVTAKMIRLNAQYHFILLYSLNIESSETGIFFFVRDKENEYTFTR
jgi:hypothetical protein